MGVKVGVEVWDDVFREEWDELSAPSLGQLYLDMGAPEIYRNATEFFRRTLITISHLEILEEVVKVLSGRGGHRVIVLQSLFGGGKTHTLTIIYHALRNPEALLEAKLEREDLRERLRHVVNKLKSLSGVDVIVIDGYYEELAPTPSISSVNRPRTLWGVIADRLRIYDKVREYDEKLSPPGIDKIMPLIRDRKVLLLVDEIGNYITRLSSSTDESVQRYLKNAVPSFFEILAKAFDSIGTSMLIISLPLELGGDGREYIVEKGYEASKDVLMAIHRAVNRVSAKNILPVDPQTLPLVLRVRLFKKVDERNANASKGEFQKVYQEFKDVFENEASKAISNFPDNYPFHPSYVETLAKLVNEHERLQKTRDAIRISRIVIRRLWESREDPYAIMSWHISLDDKSLRSKLFSHIDYRSFELIYEEEGVKKTRSYDKPELAKIIYTTILLRTFYLPPSWVRVHIYPNAYEIATAVYEPSKFKSLRLQPIDIVNALKWLHNNVGSVYSRDNRYWISTIVNPIREVESRANAYTDEQVSKYIVDKAKKLLVSGIGIGKRREKEQLKTIFDIANSKVIKSCEPLDFDEKKYILLVCLEELTKEQLEDLIFRTSRGGSRRNRNTVFVLFVGDKQELANAYKHAKQLQACNDVKEEIDTRYPDKDIRDVVKKKLENHCYREDDSIENMLESSVNSALNKLAYPTYKENRDMVETRLVSELPPLLEKVQTALKNMRPEKFKEELGFDEIKSYLENIGVNIEDERFRRSVSGILEYFYTNPRLPVVSEDAVFKAIKEGLLNFEIGLLKNGKLMFKKPVECKLSGAEDESKCLGLVKQIDEGPHVDVDSKDEVVSWAYALRETIKMYSKPEERKTPGGVERIEYAFRLGEKLIHVSDIPENVSLKDLCSAPLVKIVRVLREGVLLEHSPTSLEVEEGKGLPEVTITVERVGGFSGEVRLEASVGKIEPAIIKVSAELSTVKAVLKLPELKGGSHMVEVKAYNDDGRLLTSITIPVIVKTREEGVHSIPLPSLELEKLVIEIDRGSALKPIEVLVKILGDKVIVSGNVSFEAPGGRDSQLTVDFTNVFLPYLKSVLLGIARANAFPIKGRLIVMSASGSTFKIPELSDEDRRVLEGRLTYYAAR